MKMHSKSGMTTTSETQTFVKNLYVSRASYLKKLTKYPKVKSMVYVSN